MVCDIRSNLITIAIFNLAVVHSEPNVGRGDIHASSRDHIMVTDMELFPYVVAILRMASYLSAGAMISDSWVLTAADALYLVRESIREIRVRMGSVNYKKGGLVLPIKYFRIHPYFDDRTPIYDLAMLKLSQPVICTSYIRPIQLRRKIKEPNSIHFIVTAWALHNKNKILKNKTKYDPALHNRQLMVRQISPTNTNECRIHQEKLEIIDTLSLLCLDSNKGTDQCDRAVGAPVVKNGELWGIVSSWRHEHCESHPGPSFVNLVTSPNIGLWINAVLRDLHWQIQNFDTDDIQYVYLN